jgi:ATP-dependent 26S proteasome regulatory subunit
VSKTAATKSNPWGSKTEKKTPPIDQRNLKNPFASNIRRNQNQQSVPVPDVPKSLVENNIKNMFNASIRQPQAPAPVRQVHAPPPQEPEEEKTPFSSFKTGRQLLSIQESNKNIRPQGLSKKHSDPLRKKFQIPFPKTESTSNINETAGHDIVCNLDHPLLKGFDKSMLEKIQRDIVDDKSSQVSWDDIAGLQNIKDLINHSIVIPTLNPEVCGGLRRPPRAFLLFGPPGTGKTLIGKCIANEVDATFMSISASTLTSKWIGESETLVRAMFALAKVLQPCVIFFDEVDSLLGKRDGGDGGGASESMNRLKTEFLIQLDGANSLKDTDKVILIGATNRPNTIDEAMIRRFTRRILIPLPNAKARVQLIKNLLDNTGENHSLTDEDLKELAGKTEGYSGADLKNLAVEASHIPFRKAVKIHGLSVRKEEVSKSFNNF